MISYSKENGLHLITMDEGVQHHLPRLASAHAGTVG